MKMYEGDILIITKSNLGKKTEITDEDGLIEAAYSEAEKSGAHYTKWTKDELKKCYGDWEAEDADPEQGPPAECLAILAITGEVIEYNDGRGNNSKYYVPTEPACPPVGDWARDVLFHDMQSWREYTFEEAKAAGLLEEIAEVDIDDDSDGD